MTIGSPVASSVSGPGTELMNATLFPSGDQVMLFPVEGRGLFVPCITDRNLLPEPSGRAIIKPDLSPSCPRNAIQLPSGDQTGPEEASFSAPMRMDLLLLR